MTIRINNIKLSINDDISLLEQAAIKKLRVNKGNIKKFKIAKESIDARRKGRIDFIYSLELKIDGNERKIVEKINDKDIVYEEDAIDKKNIYGSKKLESRPIIIGSGPAGLFAGLCLAQNGYEPIIFERGKCVEERTKAVYEFWNKKKLDTECNVQFGEGGAGTFSDGKLTTRIKDVRCSYVLEEFIKAGANEDILYNYKPHIGTDVLKNVVSNIRKKIIALGGEVYFSSKLTDINIENGVLKAITINNMEINCDTLILAIGHSARDTFEMLSKKGIVLYPKPFAVGFRIEHRQKMIDEAQFGEFANHPKLRAADYKLIYHSKRYDRSCYSFCMCPGGIVVAAASEEGMQVTNGMSEYARDKENANSAIVCSVGIDDFEGDTPLAGIYFQRRLEKLAFEYGGRDYSAPVQLVGDFLKNKASNKIGAINPSNTTGYKLTKLNDCLPINITEALKEALMDFDNKIKGFAANDAVLTGLETRTSSPVRIQRNEALEAVNNKGIYPAGEGAGYAGGIVSAAVDGIKAAEEIMKIYKPIIK